MADNVGYTPGSGAKVATREVSYSGETALVQVVGLATVSGPDDATTVQDVSLSNPMPTVANQSDDLLRIMLSRMLKLMESNAIVDQQQRQRITIDAISGGLTLSALSTVSTVSNISAGTLTNVISNAGMDREQYINIAKNTYANSIRSQLTFS
jgi:hypothetical protein